VHQLRGSLGLTLPQKGEQRGICAAQLLSDSPIATICSGTGGLKDGCEMGARGPPALLIGEAGEKTSGDGPASPV